MFFVITFLGFTVHSVRLNSFPIILILLTSRNIASLNGVTICEKKKMKQKKLGCTRSGTFRHKLQLGCFHL